MGAFGGGELLDFSRKGQSGLKPLVSSRPNRDAIQAPLGAERYEGRQGHAVRQDAPGPSGPVGSRPRTARAFPTQ